MGTQTVTYTTEAIRDVIAKWVDGRASTEDALWAEGLLTDLPTNMDDISSDLAHSLVIAICAASHGTRWGLQKWVPSAEMLIEQALTRPVIDLSIWSGTTNERFLYRERHHAWPFELIGVYGNERWAVFHRLPETERRSHVIEDVRQASLVAVAQLDVEGNPIPAHKFAGMAELGLGK